MSTNRVMPQTQASTPLFAHREGLPLKDHAESARVVADLRNPEKCPSGFVLANRLNLGHLDLAVVLAVSEGAHDLGWHNRKPPVFKCPQKSG
eukprot:455710-Prorocentrum_minimum.AAC.1